MIKLDTRSDVLMRLEENGLIGKLFEFSCFADGLIGFQYRDDDFLHIIEVSGDLTITNDVPIEEIVSQMGIEYLGYSIYAWQKTAQYSYHNTLLQ